MIVAYALGPAHEEIFNLSEYDFEREAQEMRAARYVSLLCKCPRCEETTMTDIAVADDYDIGRSAADYFSGRESGSAKPSLYGEVIAYHPSPRRWEPMDGCPPEIAEHVRDIAIMLDQEMRPSTILGAIGTAFELALKKLDKTSSGGTKRKDLFKRIDELGDTRMVNWSLS